MNTLGIWDQDIFSCGPDDEPLLLYTVIKWAKGRKEFHCVQAACRQSLCLAPAADLGRSGGRQTMPTSAQLPQRRIIVFKGRRQHIDLTIPVVGLVGMFLLLLC
jgi:hypothetical protein